MRRIGLFSGIVAGGLVLASPALAGWGEDWGTMVWGAAPVGVPTLGLLGLGLLSLALAAAAVFSLRRRAWTMSVLLVALAIPLAAVASPITGLNVFSNGTTADANDVNDNFDTVKTAVDDNDGRISAVETDAAAAQSTADAAVTDAAAAQATADAAQVRVASTCPAGSSIQAIAADGTVTCEVDTDTNTTYSAGSGLGLGGTTFTVNPTQVQSRVTGECPAGESIRRIKQGGAVICETDTDTIYTAGEGLDLAGTTFALGAGASTTGRAEINQACAADGCFPGDSAGFPVMITEPGSYVLTSNLTVPDENTDAIYVIADDVSIDLNGFAIVGPVTCSGSPLTCSPGGALGTGRGVYAVASVTGASVKNGSIMGMGYAGVRMQNSSEIKDLQVRWNRTSGILTGSGSSVSDNTAHQNGHNGINVGAGSTVTGNTASDNGIGGINVGAGSTVTGNTANSNATVGINADAGSTVSGNAAYQNGTNGIYASSGSTVSGNAVRGNNWYGLYFDGSQSAYSENVISDNTAGTVNGSAVQLGQNACDGNTTCP